ncbi:GNAT family N-acetyltransferase [Pseudomonas sp. ITEM 17296]|uniref:GNAT family N-acetyltransferase n=1 Tax=Pseudomonas sp. ITEM 17296 TaxID=2790281 RepID=UPI0023801507|nr:GNAT family N-acetyltransferase [Pseudomonas sp. ITEM 17296]MDE4537520.1 GNAT family N-acetyltransferase [Pseudomonas sp. ITEM 17296]
MHIRPTLTRDIPWLAEVERSAAQAFAQLPALAWLAQGEVLDSTAHQGFVDAGASWLAEGDAGQILGFVCARREHQALHIHEISVRREAQGQGIGRLLLNQLVDAAQAAGVRELTLTTFVDVPWNAPFYARYGFETIDEGLLCSRLGNILANERAHGFVGRCAMRMSIG